jgi:hypothetical protein
MVSEVEEKMTCGREVGGAGVTDGRGWRWRPAELLFLGYLGSGVGGSFHGRLLRGVSVGGRPSKEGGVWAARLGGDSVAGRAVADNRWVDRRRGQVNIVVRKGGVEGEGRSVGGGEVAADHGGGGGGRRCRGSRGATTTRSAQRGKGRRRRSSWRKRKGGAVSMAAPIDDGGFRAGQRGGGLGAGAQADIYADETDARKKLTMWWDPCHVCCFQCFFSGGAAGGGPRGVSMECYPRALSK